MQERRFLACQQNDATRRVGDVALASVCHTLRLHHKTHVRDVLLATRTRNATIPFYASSGWLYDAKCL